MDGENVQADVAAGDSSEESSEQQQQQEQYDPSELLANEGQRDAVISALMGNEATRKQVLATNEAQSEINRTADSRFKGYVSSTDRQLETLKGEIQGMRQGTQVSADHSLMTQWEGLTPEQRAEQVQTNSDLPLQVAEAKKRLSATPAEQTTAAQTNGAGVTAELANEFVWSLKKLDGFKEMSDQEYNQVVQEAAGGIDRTSDAAYAQLVDRVYKQNLTITSKAQKTEQEAQKRETNADDRQTAPKPLVGSQRGASTGSVSYYEEKLAKEGDLSPDEWPKYMEARDRELSGS